MVQIPSLTFTATLAAVEALVQHTPEVCGSLFRRLCHLLQDDHYSTVSEAVLERLCAYYPHKCTDELLYLLAPPGLHRLHLVGCDRITSIGLHRVLQKCERLSSLHLKECRCAGNLLCDTDLPVNSPPFNTAFNMTQPGAQLTSLCLSGSELVTDTTVKNLLQTVPSLRQLILADCSGITDHVFLLDDLHQLTRTEKTEQVYSCQLTTVDISNCTQLSSTAIYHMATLCGPTLKDVNIFSTGSDCIALLYLCGYSMMTALRIAKVIEGSPLTLLDQSLLASEMERYSISELLRVKKDSGVMRKCDNKSVVISQCNCYGDKDSNESCDHHNEASTSDKVLKYELDSYHGTTSRTCDQPCDMSASCNGKSLSCANCDLKSSNVKSFSHDNCDSKSSNVKSFSCDNCDSKSSNVKSFSHDNCDSKSSNVKSFSHDNCDSKSSISKSVLVDNYHPKSSIDKSDGDCAFALSGASNTEHVALLTEEAGQVFEVETIPMLYFDFQASALTEEEMNNKTVRTVSRCHHQPCCNGRSVDSGVSLNECCTCTLLERASASSGIASACCSCCKVGKSASVNPTTVDVSEAPSACITNSEHSPGPASSLGSLAVKQDHVLDHDHEIPMDRLPQVSQGDQGAILTEGAPCKQDSNCQSDKLVTDSDNEDGVEIRRTENCEKSKPVMMFPTIYKSNLQALDMSYIALNERDLSSACLLHLLCRNPRIQQLQLSWKELDDEILENIIADHAKELKCISLTDCHLLTTQGVASLCTKCKNLSILNLQGVNFIQDGGVAGILSNGNVTKLGLSETMITDKSLSKIATYSADTLQELDLSWCEEISDEGLNQVALECHNLRRWLLQQCPITDTTIHLMAQNCTNLRHLRVTSYDGFLDEHLVTLALRLKHLEHLDISWSLYITDLGMSALLRYSHKLHTLITTGMKIITSKPFWPIVSDVPTFERCKAMLLMEKRLRENQRQDNCVFISSDEDDDGLFIPLRSARYAPSLHRLELEWCDSVNESHLAEIAVVCRGSIHITDYYGNKVHPALTMHPKR